MAWSSKKPKSKCTCMYCGKEIKWVRKKGAQRSTPVEVRNVYFLPDESGRDFITPDGNIRKGREAGDGLLGYFKHDCPMKPGPRVLSEKELLRRQWA